VNISLTNPVGGAPLGLVPAAVLTITDFEAGTLQFSAPTFTVTENGTQATVTVTRTGGSDGVVSAQLATSNGTATAGSDYTAVTQTVTFGAGDTAAKTVTIPISDDQLVEQAETVNLTLSAATGGAKLGTPATATLTITDNDVASAVKTKVPALVKARGTTAAIKGITFTERNASVTLTVKITIKLGKLTVIPGHLKVKGNNSRALTLTGTAAAINKVLASLTAALGKKNVRATVSVLASDGTTKSTGKISVRC